MYDPARDSWNASSDNSADERESKKLKVIADQNQILTSTDNEVEQQPQSESLEEVQDKTEEQQIKEDKSNSSVIESRPLSQQEKVSQDDSEPKSNSSIIESRPLPREEKVSQDDEPKSTNLKKPSRRSDISERNKKTEELRDKIEKRHRSEDSEDIQYPPQKKQSVEGIRQHYNQRPNTSVQERKTSPIIKLRSFNNLIKSMLILKFTKPNNVVLDIGCGKGGDLQKWLKQRISGFIGIDIADISVSQAKERYAAIRHKPFWADFCVGDAFSERIEDIVHPDAFPVDIVSSQFTLQYSFEDESRARTMLSNVSRALKRGGIFIGTIPDSSVLLSHIAKLPRNENTDCDNTFASKEWGNSIYKIRFENDPPAAKEDLNKIYGYKYEFFLEDAVTNVPEYMVPFDSFCSLAKEYGLRLIYQKQFLDMFDEEVGKGGRMESLARILKVYKDDGSLGIEGDQREATGIYTTFAFVKD